MDLSANDVVLQPDDCPKLITMTLRAIDPDALREAAFDVSFVGTGAAGTQTPLNGVTVKARLDCKVEEAGFLDGRTLEWRGAPFTACADVFDLVRGPLSAAGGGLSAAECLLDDWPDPAVSDPEDPLPGRGFFYLIRSGGSEPGTFNDGFQAGDRDAALAFCS